MTRKPESLPGYSSHTFRRLKGEGKLWHSLSSRVPRAISGLADSLPLVENMVGLKLIILNKRKFAHTSFLAFFCASAFIPAVILFFSVIQGAFNNVYAESAPQRIISMSPAITEILFAIGAGDKVVGVTDFCVYPPEAAKLPKLGGILNPNIEAMISIRPDLIIHHYDSVKIQDFAKTMGVEYLPVKLTDLNSILDSIQKIGRKIDLADNAEKLAMKLKTDIDFYKNKLKPYRKKSVLLLLGDSDDPMRDLYAAGRNTFLGELLDIAGGENIIPETFAEYPKVSREYIIKKSPEAIIIAGPMANLSSGQKQINLRRWARFPTIRAVKNNNIHFIGNDYILIPGPRLISLIEQFAKRIHPKLFANSN